MGFEKENGMEWKRNDKKVTTKFNFAARDTEITVEEVERTVV